MARYLTPGRLGHAGLAGTHCVLQMLIPSLEDRAWILPPICTQVQVHAGQPWCCMQPHATCLAQSSHFVWPTMSGSMLPVLPASGKRMQLVVVHYSCHAEPRAPSLCLESIPCLVRASSSIAEQHLMHLMAMLDHLAQVACSAGMHAGFFEAPGALACPPCLPPWEVLPRATLVFSAVDGITAMQVGDHGC